MMKHYWRHIPAIFGSFFISVIIQVLQWSFSIQNLEDPVADPPILFSVCLCTVPSLILCAVILPLVSDQFEKLLIDRLQWSWWQHTSGVAAIYFGCGFILTSPVWLLTSELTFNVKFQVSLVTAAIKYAPGKKRSGTCLKALEMSVK